MLLALLLAHAGAATAVPPVVSPEVDLTTRMAFALIDHWPLVAALLALGYWVFPRALKATLQNGGGEIIQKIVDTANEKQSVIAKDELDRRFKEHEQVEKERFAAGESRFVRLESDVSDMKPLYTRRTRRRS